MDKFTAGLERAISDLVEGAVEISKKLLAGELEWRTKKAKAKRTARPKKPREPRATFVQPKPKPVVGDLWKRRDGDSARHVLAVDDTHVTVDSPIYDAGTKVKLVEFTRRYKKVG